MSDLENSAPEGPPQSAPAPGEGAVPPPEKVVEKEVPSPRPEGAGEPPVNPQPRPEGEPPAVVALRELIESKLGEVVERYSADEKGAYVFALESALVYVVPAWLATGATVVRIFAITNLDVPVTAELTSFLLGKNLEFVLGGFALDTDHGAVWFHHNLLGEYLAPEELEATLGAVAATANDLDDEIKARFGGRLYIETPDASIPPPVVPGYL